jgi:hypothetical protein
LAREHYLEVKLLGNSGTQRMLRVSSFRRQAES